MSSQRLIFIFPFIVFLFCAGYMHPSHAMQNQSALKAMQDFTQQVDQLTQSPATSQALKFIKDTDAQTVEDQKALTELPAPPFKENQFGRSKRFAELLKEYGADSVWTDSIGNVIGLRKGMQRNRVLAIAGHLDTVFPEGTDVNIVQKGDTLFAPGISDDGRGLTTVLAVLRSLDETNINLKADVLFIGNVGEEGLGDLRGMKYLFREEGPQIDNFISVDGTGFSSITNGALGSHRYKVTVSGPGGHSWGAFGLANTHHGLARGITSFVDRADTYTREDGPKTSYNVGRIGGGTSVNSIPFESWMEVDMRSLSPERLVEIDTLFHQAVRKGVAAENDLRREGPAMQVSFDMIGNRPSGHTAEDEAIVQRAIAVTNWMKLSPRLRTSSTDSNIPISKGISAITIGGGGQGGSAHSLDEWYLNKEGYKGIQRAFLIVTSTAGLDEADDR